MLNGISVIIPTLNRGDFLQHTLECLSKQKCDCQYEVIVVDQSDHVDSALANNQDIRYFNTATLFKGLPEARNYGAQKAIYDILLFIDDDVDFEPDFVQQHFDSYTIPNVSAVAGGITEKNNPNVDCKKPGAFSYWFATPYRGFHLKEAQWVSHGPGGNYSILRSLYFSIGGTDEYLNYGAALYEESELFLRAKETGAKVWFNPDAHLWHLAAPFGGCRVTDINKYITSLVHNRAIVITRHLRWFHKPIALLCLAKLVTAYAVKYRRPSLFKTFLNSYRIGRVKAFKSPKLTIYQ